MKKVLGLDLGTNSIGWALVEQDFDQNQGKILGLGSRIIPMDAGDMGKFAEGASISKTAERTRARMVRRLYERANLRRERLHRILNILEFLPEHYAHDIDFDKHYGKFRHETETKLPWRKEEDGSYSFLFQSSFNEMIEDFKANGHNIRVPYDWTIYYLRKKAVAQKISKEELAWLILNFNQKRGYYQLRGEEEESNTMNEYVVPLKITGVEPGESDKKNDRKRWYSVSLENGWTYSATFMAEPKWLGMTKDFLVTEELDEAGNVKIVKDRKTDVGGKEKRRITPLPSFDEIDLMSKSDQDRIYKKIKARTELTIANSGKTVGTFIYEGILRNPTQKIRGKLVRTIERKFYKDELQLILNKQIELQPELFTKEKYLACVRELYRSNHAHQVQLAGRDFVHLFLEDILFYQRPLKSQKSSVGNCSMEFRTFNRKSENGQSIKITEALKATPKSNPYYQEFRVWQWLFNLKIYLREDETDVTQQFIRTVSDIENLFDFLMAKESVTQADILDYFIRPVLVKKYPGAKAKALNDEIKKETALYRWNYGYDDGTGISKSYPMNQTGHEIRKRLGKVGGMPKGFLTRELEQRLWHIIYSVTNREEFEKALASFARNHALDVKSFAENFKNFRPFQSDYGSFSEKAIKKLLPLMRIGKYWKWQDIDSHTRMRIEKMITGEWDEELKHRVREKAIHLTKEEDFQGLQLWLASYIIYDRHSESGILGKWHSVQDLDCYLKEFRQHSLRNPIVEQIITETLRVVKDIWIQYGDGRKDYFDEIHVELGREMKNTAKERERIARQVSENENTNVRIRALITEMKEDPTIENVRPFSPVQQEVLKIYEDGVLNSGVKLPDDILKISKTAQPSKSEITRYKLWLEQKYRSPYTGQPIPLSKLFTAAYEIEHVIPQSRFFDDSFNNKVICESVVNKKKDNMLGLEFIKNHGGEFLQDGNKQFRILTESEYKEFVKDYYGSSMKKRNILLLEEVPEKMIERQMNDTRYISKFVSQLLSNIVRSEKDDDGVNSKNLVFCNGQITSRLKRDWGLNDVWNQLILYRFERMNEVTGTTAFTTTNREGHTIPDIPADLLKGFQKKRIDHRHHAMDALAIACATRDHVNLLNNQSAKSDEKRYDLQKKLRNTEKWSDENGKDHNRFASFRKPWGNFSKDAAAELEKIVVSFKQNLRIINKASNKFHKIQDGKRVAVNQTGTNWAIRKPMHKDTVSGKVDLPHVKVPKGKILTATRKSLDTTFDLKTINSITDTGIQKILKNYLVAKGSPEAAFSPEGLEELNRNISLYNDGKLHQPISKVRIFEIGSKFPIGQRGNKKEKFVEAAKGTNLFFVVYERLDNHVRMFDTIPLNEVIAHQTLRGHQPGQMADSPEIPIKNVLDYKGKEVEVRYLFHLSPNDLVYVPTQEEINVGLKIDLKSSGKNRTYKMVSSTGTECHFVQSNIAHLIKSYDSKTKVGELGSLNKLETTIDANQSRIKEICVKLAVDRLGKITAYTSSL